MNTSKLTLKSSTKNLIKLAPKRGFFKKVIDSYKAYCKVNGNEKIYWYMKVIIIVPCVIMIPSISAFYAIGVQHEIYVGLCMLLFFSNVITHLTELSSSYYIPVYHLTITLMIFIPAIAYIIKSF